MITALGSGLFAATFLAIGRWGRRNVTELVPATLSPEARTRKERSLRRGSWSVSAIGVLFALLGLIVALESVIDTGTTR